MKGLKVLLFVCITLFFFSSCVFMSPAAMKAEFGGTGTGNIAAVPYSAVKDNDRTVEMTFQTNLTGDGGSHKTTWGDDGGMSIQLVSIDGEEIPLPERRTVWNPVTLPADKPLTLIVNVFRYSTQKDSIDLGYFGGFVTITAGGWLNMDVTLNCPSLEAGKNYKLEYKPGKNKEFLGLVVGWIPTKLVITDTKTKKSVYEQSIEGEKRRMDWKAGRKRKLGRRNIE